MIVCHDPQFVYFGLPRCASRSIHQWLLRRYPNAIATKHRHQLNVPEEARGYPSFAAVRNPYTLHVSHYLYRHTNRGNNMYPWCRRWNFLEYLQWLADPARLPREAHEPSQMAQILAYPHTFPTCLPIEGLPGCLQVLPSIANDDPFDDLPHEGLSPDYDFMEYYRDNKQMKAHIVKAINGGDFLNFDYFGYDAWMLPKKES